MVEELIRRLGTALPSFAGNQTTNIEYAKEVRRHATRLRNKLKSPPHWFLPAALFTERFWWLHGMQEDFGINPNTRGYAAEASEQQEQFFKTLDRLCTQCDRIIKRRPGGHASTKHLHRHAATAARDLLQTIAAFGGPPLQLGLAPTSKYCSVARLLLEAATGKHGKDVTRACRNAAALNAKT